jgi:hypothetical protein
MLLMVLTEKLKEKGKLRFLRLCNWLETGNCRSLPANTIETRNFFLHLQKLVITYKAHKNSDALTSET